MAGLDEYTISYAQNREDMILAAFFNEDEHGFYIDIGANHPQHDSVTKYFYDRGWYGLNIEPNSKLYQLLESERPRDINIKLGVADKPGKLKLREYEGLYDGLSTFSTTQQKEQKSGIAFKDKIVEVLPLKEICKSHHVTSIQFMKIDVEGFESEVIAGNDWKTYRPEVICIEANHIDHDWRPTLQRHGYFKVFFDGLNEYYIASEARQRAEHFSYVQSIIGRNFLPEKVFKDVQDTQAQIIKYKSETIRYREESESYQHEVSRLNSELLEFQRVVPLVKQLVKSLDAAVRRRIERLNTRKTKRPKPFEFDANDNKLQLLAKVKLYDFDTYYRKNPQNDRRVYKVAVGVYKALYKMAFFILITTYKFIRRIRR